MENREVVLTDGRSFNCATSIVSIEYPMGYVRATLVEYTLTEATTSKETIVYKLHKTKDGFWYDHPFMEKPGAFLMMTLKKAIDEAENDQAV
ncbi:hypothetical protein FRZ67_19340 [Panacibacter ginsenosidivorans]|uniref:Uncharacterized protein n=1 Tax=Panacibacter ginsenosidivorans TaxID=1813871 RepID=A0A5B8VFN4_9BACT|nr:hypothetical protein [Panacibacter ginsenosidivorans]QEC69356.1 hypothetical protein FRZ67_19340 [Panacibacter ginsenosidivorans]